MRSFRGAGTCFALFAALASPVIAEGVPDFPEPVPLVMPQPNAGTQAIIAAQNAKTLHAVAEMQTRLAAIVPFAQRTDAIAQSAIDFAAQWQNVIDNYANTQAQMVNLMIASVNVQTQDSIEAFLSAEPMVPPDSLFDGSTLDIRNDFLNPPPINAGFFGS